ncbi:MAG TPA: DNA polymerase ligase N-terminal domain-containing protein [Microthrixaceae bacterium]|nr:DNA polymerase ligase N-terminal domain-containing protein [Microthrixaceae bacterium]
MAGSRTAEQLRTYRAKRDFSRTKEPAGGRAEPPAPGAAPRFVVQRHRARRLHYDLRFEIDGVLVSFAVPKGPSLDPSVKRLAVQTEDHPIEYYDFEGVIPAGEYGGGDVIVWDWGTWELHAADDAAAAVEAGELHADMYGEKLKGRLVLVRRGKGHSRGGTGPKSQWLLFHKHDEDAVDGWDPEDHPESVRSGRTNDEVAADPDALWDSDAPADRARISLRFEGPDPDELTALDELGAKGAWRLGGRDLRLTNLDKVLAPGRDGPGKADRAPITKRDLIRYHADAAPLMLPHLVDRPVNLHRFPDGVTKKGFWHKAVPDHAPDWIRRWEYPDAGPGETQWYFVADSTATLAWLANYGAIELHPWTSRCDDAHRPTAALFDIDPGTDTTWDDLVVLARLHRTAFEHLGVEAYPKVSGQRGIQIWVPIVAEYTFEETAAWVETVSRSVGGVVPELVSWKWSKAERGGKARLDYTQNAINKTLVVPYGARPAPGMPVSAPITWDELDDPDLRPDRWTIRTILDRVDEVGDLWAGFSRAAQRLPELEPGSSD